MSFIIDKQTRNDLNLSGKYRSGSIFSLFNKVKTAGGEKLLQQMFNAPFTDTENINKRSGIFQYIQHSGLDFPFNSNQFKDAEDYLAEENNDFYFISFVKVYSKKIRGVLLREQQYDNLIRGLAAMLSILNTTNAFLNKYRDRPSYPLDDLMTNFRTVLEDTRLGKLIGNEVLNEMPLYQIAEFDFMLRQRLRKEMLLLLETLFHLDVYTAVARVAELNNFSYAESVKSTDNIMEIDSLRHPALPKGVANHLRFGQPENMVFLTGANMAGKSTLMKSFGIAVYLAHLGFPIAAKSMRFSVRDGLFSSINMADNLEMGHSHFYAEVLRVKEAAVNVASGKSFVVLFDELFKGTNVKDAYDGTLLVTKAFSKYQTAVFIISTHIIEVGEELRKSNGDIQFKYLPTIMNGTIPNYTYLLKDGITSDRQGMLIIENEGILQLLKD
ncbi:DNA mismatch repair protein [Pedobacter sp. Leaf250]|uniref:MutS-related protein n=1 Tax=Pedobacter sp. Leaf250 TaxID=2876559 RepID=UPI001E51DFB6|nr:DNA mismatch repair protein [Pedobacter sp. Leaf250]